MCRSSSEFGPYLAIGHIVGAYLLKFTRKEGGAKLCIMWGALYCATTNRLQGIRIHKFIKSGQYMCISFVVIYILHLFNCCTGTLF